MQVSQPICLINNSGKLCLVKKNTSCHQHDTAHISGWLTEAAWGASPFYTHLKIAVISICLLLPGSVPPHCSHYRLAHKTSVSSRKGCHHWSNILWWPPFSVYSNICHPAPPQLFYDTFDIERKSMQSNCFWSPLLLPFSALVSLFSSLIVFQIAWWLVKNQPTMVFWRKH